MKYIIIILIASICNGCGYGQFPKSKIDSKGNIYNANRYTQMQFDSIHATIKLDSGTYWYRKPNIADTIFVISGTYVKDTVWRMFDTLKVIMQVSDTSRSAWDTKIYWIKGYKVLGDYDTYYLDILKQPLRKSIIVWLDQNL